MDISAWLFKRGLQGRWRVGKELLMLTLDFWVALYIVIPALILIGCTYSEWLQALPNWYRTDFHGMWAALIALLVTRGIPRTYLGRSDLVLIYPYRQQFRKLMAYGQILSTFLKSVPLLLALFFAYPFFYHVQSVNIHAWLLTAFGILIFKTIVLQINWHLVQHLGRWFFRLYSVGMFAVLWWGWYRIIEPYILGNSTIISLVFALVLAIALTAFINRKFKVCDWDAVVTEEENQDIDKMRLFLGNAAQVEKQGRSKQIHIGKGRMGIAFRPSRVFTYFFVKYFIRKKQLWQDFGQFYALAVVVLLQNVPFGAKSVFMIAVLLGMGGMLQLYWKEHSQDLFLRMLPMQWNDIQQSIKISFYIILWPFCLLFLLVLPGNTVWWQGLAFLPGLFLIAGLISNYLSLKVSVLFNYHEE